MSTNSLRYSLLSSNIRQSQSNRKSSDRYSKERRSLHKSLGKIKSMTTLPSKHYLDQSSSRAKYVTNLIKLPIKSSFDPKITYLYTTNSNRKNPQGANVGLRKIFGKDKKHGYIYKSPIQASNRESRHFHTENPEGVQSSSHLSIEHLQLQDHISKLQQQNTLLRSKLLDKQLKQRQHIERINKLETLCVKLEELMGKKRTLNKEESEFIAIMKNTFQECFGINDLKEIWGKQKAILKQWMEFTMESQKDIFAQDNSFSNDNKVNPQNLQYDNETFTKITFKKKQ